MEGRGPNEALRPRAHRRPHTAAKAAAQHPKPVVTGMSAHENGLGWDWGRGSALSLQGLRTGAVRLHLGLSQLAWSLCLINYQVAVNYLVLVLLLFYSGMV